MTKRSDENPKQPRFEHKKSLGQNFLTSDVVPKWLCDAASLQPGEIVLEIGPGTGRLTTELLQRGVIIHAVEADIRAIDLLRETFAEAIERQQLFLHHGDAREIHPAILGLQDHHFTVVANIPYYLSGFLLRQLLGGEIQPKTLVFLMQKELVERIARAKKESLLSLSIKAFGTPAYIKTVTRGHFFPKPNVDSAILAITDINRYHFSTFSPDFFFHLLHLGLGKKRKQLVTNLSTDFNRQAIEQVFAELGFTPAVRGEDLKLHEWLNLTERLNKIPQPSQL